MGLLAFGATILLGLRAGNPTDVILVRALWALFVFCVIGLVVGYVAYRVLDEHAMRRNRELFGDDEDDEEAVSESGGTEGAPAGETPAGGGAKAATPAQPAETAAGG